MFYTNSIRENGVRAFDAQVKGNIAVRKMYMQNERNIAANTAFAGIQANQGFIPRDVWQEIDIVTTEVMHLDDGEAFLGPLLARSRPVNIGRLVFNYRKASDAGNVVTSISGQSGTNRDKVNYSYDGTIIPIKQSGFTINWRELEGQKAEGFDSIVDNVRENTRNIRENIADSFLDGFTDKDGNLINIDDKTWGGIRNDPAVGVIDIGGGGINFDFSLTTNTGDEIRNALIRVRDAWRFAGLCPRDLILYVSNEIDSNFERKFSNLYQADNILTQLDIRGISSIVATNKLVGNEMMAYPAIGNDIQPLMGQGLTTVALNRPEWNSDFVWEVWTAMGFLVRTDANGNTCTFYIHEV